MEEVKIKLDNKDLLKHQNPRAKYKLNYNDFTNMCKVSQGIMDLHLVITPNDIDKAIIMSLDVFKQYFPNVKYSKLEPAGTDMLMPAYAFKLYKNSPEVYMLFNGTEYNLIDQGRCEMYGEADGHKLYKKPEWKYE